MTTNECLHPKGVIGLKQWRCLVCGETRDLPPLNWDVFEPPGFDTPSHNATDGWLGSVKQELRDYRDDQRLVK